MAKLSVEERMAKASKAKAEKLERRKRALGEEGLKKQLLRKEKFAAAYFADPSINDAGVKAGYSLNTVKGNGYKLLQDPEVQEMLQKHREDFNKECKATVQWKTDKLIRIIDEFVPDDGKVMFDTRAMVAIRAIAELNKMQGHYMPEKIESTNLNANLTIIEKREVKELVLKYDKEY